MQQIDGIYREQIGRRFLELFGLRQPETFSISWEMTALVMAEVEATVPEYDPGQRRLIASYFSPAAARPDPIHILNDGQPAIVAPGCDPIACYLMGRPVDWQPLPDLPDADK
ncbi:MAG: hypothetical protein OXE87_09635 [Chloroflexi bacterium]|nr:hypothetical protein [Chloroflexota bacterium]